MEQSKYLGKTLNNFIFYFLMTDTLIIIDLCDQKKKDIKITLKIL
jgi:hypothetical protein